MYVYIKRRRILIITVVIVSLDDLIDVLIMTTVAPVHVASDLGGNYNTTVM